MRVIGTAGHVDHGKSTLVKALTGIDPDRLKEEKVRQMTIDLGFAWYQDALGEEIGIVDVPGHRDFIENMLSGISAIDAVLLVIAGDEGVMPQTREHLAVLDLLKIENGMVVLTKIDLVQDPEWLDLVKDEIRKVLRDTTLEGCEIVPVSAVTGEGMAALKTQISTLLASIQPSLDTGKPRLPVDRVFSMQGFGTIVTGTLGGGVLSAGDQVEIFPPGKIARIRGIQVHQKQAQKVKSGSRAALNIAGFEPKDIKRGSVVYQPGKFIPTARIDTHVEILKDAGTVLKNNEMVKLFVATTEIQARARVLGVAELLAADKGFVQFELSEEIIAAAKDRFILRRMSPAATIGGGVIINAHPKGRYRLNDSRVLDQLQRGLTFNSDDQLLNLIEELPFFSRETLIEKSGIEPEVIDKILDGLCRSEKIFQLTGDQFITNSSWELMKIKIRKIVEHFHQDHPLMVGIPTDVIIRQMGIPKEVQSAFFTRLQQEGVVEILPSHVKLPNREIKYSPAQRNRIKSYLDQNGADPYNPPTVKASKEILGEEIYESLIDQELIVQLSQEVVLSKQAYQQMVDYVKEECNVRGSISVIGFRDHFSTNRKTSLGLLEHLDSKGITKRQGDVRVLVKM